MTSYRGKRLLDLGIGLPALILSLPMQGIIASLVRLRLGAPVLFRQIRPGLNGEPFEMLKFRTMRPLDPARGWTDDARRLTRLGAVLRSFSLDELPSLWNVVRGDMSLVGPRPLLMSYRDRYTDDQMHRHDVRPGVTGLAQVSGRNHLTWESRFELDLLYVRKQSLTFDLSILVRTLSSVVRREGINPKGEVTMPEFMGRADGKAPQ